MTELPPHLLTIRRDVAFKQAGLLRAFEEYRKSAELYIRFLIEAHYSESLEGDNLDDVLDKARRAFQSRRQELESALDKR